jgi:hypothetical protein
MPGLKVTRELHAEVRDSLKTMGIMRAAEKHHLSPQTVSRIRRGRSYLGYKRELMADHTPSFMVRDDEPDFLDMPMTKPSAPKRGFFHRLRRQRG